MSIEKENHEKYIVPAVEQASRILFCLAGSSSSYMGLIDISKKLEINKSKVYSILRTFQKFGIIRKNMDGKGYALGPGLISLSRKVHDNFNIPKLAESALEELAIKTGGTATLGLIAEENVYVVAKHEASPDIGITVRLGHHFPLTYGSHGKAIAAFMQQDELDELLQSKDLYFHGTCDKLDMPRLRNELIQCRQEGFATELGEIIPGINSVAAPVLNPGDNPIGYITLLGLFNAESARLYGPVVSETGKFISRQFGGMIT